MTKNEKPEISLPKNWVGHVRSAVLHVIGLAQYATAYTRSWAADSRNARMRLKAENDRLRQEVALLQEELRIKDARMVRIGPHKRPHYPPSERMAILELRAARGWSQQQTANAFQLTAATISSWMRRLEESGAEALVQLRQPVNRFPDLVRYAIQRLKALCPNMGKRRIADTLARAGLHLGTTTVGRILKEPPRPPQPTAKLDGKARKVTANRPNHVWHVDLTTVPIHGGFWATWLPFALPQSWPFCWWVAVVLDHYSRRVMGLAVFRNEPTSRAVRTFLGRTISITGGPPKYLISDKGGQFWCDEFKDWCRPWQIKPRFGAVGKHGSIAVIERFIGTLKREGTRRILIPLRSAAFREELKLICDWYNEFRPHQALKGCTPNEVYHRRRPANRKPRCEPREGWPRSSRCAAPQTLVAGQPGNEFSITVDFLAGRKHLPILGLKPAA